MFIKDSIEMIAKRFDRDYGPEERELLTPKILRALLAERVIALMRTHTVAAEVGAGNYVEIYDQCVAYLGLNK